MAESAETLENTLTDEERDLGLQANSEFYKKNYNECFKKLSKFQNNRNNWKIQHNKAVVEFYKNDLKNYEQLEKVLHEITNLETMSDKFEIKDSDKCIIFYNMAVLLYHQKQPFAALKILKEIMKHIKKLDDGLVQKSGFLTIQLLLDTNRPIHAMHILECIQERLGIDKDSYIVDDDDEFDVEDIDNNKGRIEQQFETKRMFKFYFIRTNLLNNKIVAIPIDESPDYTVLKAHQYYIGNDYQMAARELSKKSSNEPFTIETNGEDQNTCLANNMGLIHFSVRHYAMAARFFQHALTFDQNSTENISKESVLFAIGASKRPEILYNLGIAMLHLQRPKEAFECLLVPLNYNHNNPKLWLRLAEACIMVHKQGLKQNENPKLVSSVIGTGIHRKYVIQPTPHKYLSSEEQSFAIPCPNLEFASLCLRNAINLIEYLQNNKINQEKDKGFYSENEGYACNPSKALTQSAFDKLKCAILAAYSYVLLSLGEHVLALKYSKELLQLKNIPDTHKMLGHLYCAESLIMLNRVTEALTYLEPKFITSLNGNDFETSGSPDWNLTSCEAAQSVMMYNLAVTFLIQGEIELAKGALITCKHPIVLTQMKMLKMYMDLSAGNLENCRLTVRRDTPQYC